MGRAKRFRKLKMAARRYRLYPWALTKAQQAAMDKAVSALLNDVRRDVIITSPVNIGSMIHNQIEHIMNLMRGH